MLKFLELLVFRNTSLLLFQVPHWDLYRNSFRVQIDSSDLKWMFCRDSWCWVFLEFMIYDVNYSVFGFLSSSFKSILIYENIWILGHFWYIQVLYQLQVARNVTDASPPQNPIYTVENFSSPKGSSKISSQDLLIHCQPTRRLSLVSKECGIQCKTALMIFCC